MRWRVESGTCCRLAGGDVKVTGTETAPGAFGIEALGMETWTRPVCAPEETEKPSTGGPAARGEHASNARPMAATPRRRISLRFARGGASGALALALTLARALALVLARAPAFPRLWLAFPPPRRRPSAASAHDRA